MADWYISPTGSDSGGNGTLASPYASLAKVYSVAAANDQCKVLPGTYDCTAAATATVKVHLLGCDGAGNLAAYADRPVLRATASIANLLDLASIGGDLRRIVFDGNNLTTTSAVTAFAGNSALWDCDFVNSLGYGCYKMAAATRCRFYNNAGVGANWSSSGTAYWCVAHHNGSHGLVVTHSVGCVAYCNGGDGFSDYGITAGGHRHFCVAARNASAGIRAGGAPSIFGCIAAANGVGFGGSVTSAAGIDGNVSWGNTNADAITIDDTADPQFVDLNGNPPDLRLKPTSPYYAYDFGILTLLMGANVPPQAATGGGVRRRGGWSGGFNQV
ncbi:MAG: hypothetical protein ACM359_16535 [Bacillota bacterium]